MSTNVCYWNTNFVKIATGKAISFLWLQMKLHLHLHCETAWNSGRKERLVEIFVSVRATDNIQSPSATEICSHSCGSTRKRPSVVPLQREMKTKKHPNCVCVNCSNEHRLSGGSTVSKSSRLEVRHDVKLLRSVICN